jgi:oxygen-independent coproporphyrinogen-3 oxidase
MFGSPVETDDSWQSSVQRALGLGVDHLSTYALTVERGTPLSRAVALGAPAPDEDVQAGRWEEAAALAAASGLVRYETSNHARPGHAVAYNLITWGQGEYVAFGNAAHSHRSGRRSWNVRRVDRYVERIESGSSAESDSEQLGGWDRELERVMLGLRRSAGVTAGVAGEALVASQEGAALLDAGVLEVADGRLRIVRPMLLDEVSRRLLALEPVDC